jgi:ABC-type metal ion transport system substrate-binding protein
LPEEPELTEILETVLYDRDGATTAIPNDPANGARALQLPRY